MTDARRNKGEADRCEEQIKQIESDLDKISKDLFSYGAKIDRDERNIESPTSDELKSKKRNEDLFKAIALIGFTIGSIAFAAAVVSGAAAVGAVAGVVEVVEAAQAAGICAGAGLFGGASFATHKIFDEKRQTTGGIITGLSTRLRNERDQSANKITAISAELENIIQSIGGVSDRWKEHVNSLENLFVN